jgi:hypothetical protein
MAKKKDKKLEPDGVLAGLINQLSELEGWELREVIKSTFKLRKAIRAIEKAEARRARMAKLQKERKNAMKGLNYERTN